MLLRDECESRSLPVDSMDTPAAWTAVDQNRRQTNARAGNNLQIKNNKNSCLLRVKAEDLPSSSTLCPFVIFSWRVWLIHCKLNPKVRTILQSTKIAELMAFSVYLFQRLLPDLYGIRLLEACPILSDSSSHPCLILVESDLLFFS